MSDRRPVRLLIHGARGRMGARIASLAGDDPRFKIVAAHDREDRAQTEALAAGTIDAIIDFSSDEGASLAASLASKHRAALLVGTTGLSAETLDFIGVSARSAPVMIAPNTSLGVAVLSHLVARAAALLGPDFSIDLIESHHTQKRDAPSGTALRIVDALRRGANVELPRERVHCLRAGDIIGEHSVQFAGPGEKSIFSHAATSRDLFARGALRAAAWLAGQAPGRYTIEQSLGLE